MLACKFGAGDSIWPRAEVPEVSPESPGRAAPDEEPRAASRERPRSRPGPLTVLAPRGGGRMHLRLQMEQRLNTAFNGSANTYI